MTDLDSSLKSRESLCRQRTISQSYDFSSSHVQMSELDHREGYRQGIDTSKLWC